MMLDLSGYHNRFKYYFQYFAFQNIYSNSNRYSLVLPFELYFGEFPTKTHESSHTFAIFKSNLQCVGV
jgi:hypothetical protein